MSDPLPGYVAGYATWIALGRQVERGQSGVRPLVPVNACLDREGTIADGVPRPLTNGESAGPDETVTDRKALAGWTTGHVVAMSQRKGPRWSRSGRVAG